MIRPDKVSHSPTPDTGIVVGVQNGRDHQEKKIAEDYGHEYELEIKNNRSHVRSLTVDGVYPDEGQQNHRRATRVSWGCSVPKLSNSCTDINYDNGDLPDGAHIILGPIVESTTAPAANQEKVSRTMVVNPNTIHTKLH